MYNGLSTISTVPKSSCVTMYVVPPSSASPGGANAREILETEVNTEEEQILLLESATSVFPNPLLLQIENIGIDHYIMDERLRVIIYHYTDLEYDGFDEEQNTARTKIYTSIKELKFTDVNNFSDRFLKTAFVIEKNLPFFKSSCLHTDIITTIIEYLNYFSMKFILDSKYDEEYEKDEIVLLVLFTILKICGEYDEILCHFIINAIIGKSALEKSIQYQHLKQMYHSHTNEIILLADSDLDAFFQCFVHINFNVFDSLDLILWVQEPIKEKFFGLMKDYFTYDCEDIRIFRTKKELFTTRTADKLNIVSIWTEDIIFAKNLAISLNGDVLFINTYMDFGGIVLLPFIKIFNKTLHKWCESNFDDSIKKLDVEKKSVYNLFYDGMWQLPVKGTYWMIHDDIQWANATSDDINKCIKSAERGFKIWSNRSVTRRMQVISKFASTLKHSGKSVLADIVSEWIKFSCIYVNSLSCVSQNGRSEVTKIRNPRGVIILKEENEAVLFRRLIEVLTVGSSVIVICDANSCSLVPYCNMFSVSEIPPGVINFLSSEKVKELELSLCGMDYASYAKQFFSEDDLEKTYINLTKPKHIIVPLEYI
ncbi:uncharacterized protein [Temnothorax nylanderi]|uniref:uncharacterized protein n=1 Tax=Temnothorax nylanderi TaxID=102681 RepID=UPI003A841FA1